MNVCKLSDTEYRYIFDIDELKEAKKLSAKRYESILSSTYFNEETRKKINEISKDLDSMMESVISRTEINTYEDYKNTIDAITLANADIQLAVNKNVFGKEFGKLTKRHPIYKDLILWRTIQNHIGMKEWSYYVNQGHSTVIFLLTSLLGFLAVLIMGMISKSLLLVFACLAMMILFAILILKYNKNIEIERYTDQLHRIKNYTLPKSRILLHQKNKGLLSLLSKATYKF